MEQTRRQRLTPSHHPPRRGSRSSFQKPPPLTHRIAILESSSSAPAPRAIPNTTKYWTSVSSAPITKADTFLAGLAQHVNAQILDLRAHIPSEADTAKFKANFMAAQLKKL